MNRQQLKNYLFHKYGLSFITSPADPVHQEELRLSLSQPAFAFLSQDEPCLDLKCPTFAPAIQQNDYFGPPTMIKKDGWVGVNFDQVSDHDLQNVLDYAFQTATSGQKMISQQLIHLPHQQTRSDYQAQTIPLKSRPTPKPRQLSRLEKVMKNYDFTVSPAIETAYNFYRQGLELADYEDDYQPITEFQRYYPDYHSMNLAQLHTYFTWRTRLRGGHFSVNSTSYAYVYIYELLNNIGVIDPLSGYQQLRTFQEHYASSYGKKMVAYLQQWLQDYVLYYGLNHQAANEAFADRIAEDRQYHIVRHPQDYSATELLKVFVGWTTYLQHCRLYQNNEEEFAQLFQIIWQELVADPAARVMTLVGEQKISTGYLFGNAVFYFRQDPQQSTYIIDSERQYQLKKRQYYCTSWQPCQRRGVKLNAFFHEIDRLARQAFGLGHPLKARPLSPAILKDIQQGIQLYLAAKRRKAQKAAEPELHMGASAKLPSSNFAR